jgi:hypothetical protein
MKQLPTLANLYDAMIENRFVIDCDAYPDSVDYDHDEGITISVGDGECDLVITEIIRKDDSNVFYAKITGDDEEHTIQFLSAQAIDPFE